jgi:hypothetical protein
LNLKQASFGSKIARQWSSLQDAVLNAEAINVIVAYSSIVPLPDQPYALMNEFLAKCNEAGEIAFLHVCNLKQFFSYIQKGAEGTPIREEILMTNWNRLEGSCLAVYGCVSASDLAQLYDRHCHRIYAKNIRYFWELIRQLMRE